MANLTNLVSATLSNGGGSFNLVTGEFNPSKGYMVALEDREKVIDEADKLTAKSLQYIIADYIKEHAHILVGGLIDNNYFLGTWINKDNNKLYIDISVNMSILKEAEFIGRKYKQIAIWDCSNIQLIEL